MFCSNASHHFSFMLKTSGGGHPRAGEAASQPRQRPNLLSLFHFAILRTSLLSSSKITLGLQNGCCGTRHHIHVSGGGRGRANKGPASRVSALLGEHFRTSYTIAIFFTQLARRYSRGHSSPEGRLGNLIFSWHTAPSSGIRGPGT